MPPARFTMRTNARQRWMRALSRTTTERLPENGRMCGICESRGLGSQRSDAQGGYVECGAPRNPAPHAGTGRG